MTSRVGGGAQAAERCLDSGAVATRAHGSQSPDLLSLHRGVGPVQLDRLGVIADVLVEPDHHLLAAVDSGRLGEGCVGDFALGVGLFDGLDHAAELVDFVEVVVGGGFEFVGERFEEVGAAERVGGVGDPGFVGDHLLGSEREPDGVLGR